MNLYDRPRVHWTAADAGNRARDARGRFIKGRSGNPRGRPPGIPNPKRRVPDLAALSMTALADLIGRKPHLLRPLAAQLSWIFYG